MSDSGAWKRADLSGAVLPGPEQTNELTARYDRVLLRWVPVALKHYDEWLVRPECGHFFGGVHWYGQETAMTLYALATAVVSPAWDPSVCGCDRDSLFDKVRNGFRYLCFTHDTGPEDCVRPETELGHRHLIGTKWGERGHGFFAESQ